MQLKNNLPDYSCWRWQAYKPPLKRKSSKGLSMSANGTHRAKYGLLASPTFLYLLVCGSKTKTQPLGVLWGTTGVWICLCVINCQQRLCCCATASATHVRQFSRLKIPEYIQQSGTKAAVAVNGVGSNPKGGSCLLSLLERWRKSASLTVVWMLAGTAHCWNDYVWQGCFPTSLCYCTAGRRVNHFTPGFYFYRQNPKQSYMQYY